jgi:D-aminoacyl-tRNA deacylase
MRALVQRVSEAAVTTDRELARIGPGLLVLLGVARGDTPERADRLAAKVLKLRVFDDRSVTDAGGEVLCVSQFTLYGDTRRGNRPSYTGAAPGPEAEPLYERVCEALGARRGAFGEHMHVSLVNDGPVTLMIEV